MAEFACRVAKKRLVLDKRRHLQRVGAKSSPTTPKSSRSLFLTASSQSPGLSLSTFDSPIGQLAIQTDLETEKHERLKLESYTHQEEIGLLRSNIAELRGRISQVQCLDTLAPCLVDREAKLCVRSASRRYQLLNQEQEKLIDMQNRLYLQQHQTLLTSEGTLLKNQLRSEVLRERVGELRDQSRQQTLTHQTMLQKIGQYLGGDDKLAGYADI